MTLPSGDTAVGAAITGTGVVGNVGAGISGWWAELFGAGDATTPITALITGFGFISTDVHGDVAVMSTIVGHGVLGTIGHGSQTVNANISGAGVLGVVGSGALSVQANITGSTGAYGGTGTATETAAITGTGVLGKIGTGSQTVTAGIQGSGTATGAGAETVTAGVTGAGLVAVFGSGTETVTTTRSGTGSTGIATGATPAETATITGAGVVGKVGTGSETVTATITGTGSVDVPVSFVAAAFSTSSTITIPTYQAGDMLLAFGFRTASTIPSDPGSPWTADQTGTGGGVGYRLDHYVTPNTTLTSASGTSTNWTTIVYRGASGIGAFAYNTGTTTQPVYPALTLNKTDGTSRCLRICWQNTITSFGALTGYVDLGASPFTASTGLVCARDSNGGVTSVSADTQAASNASASWRTASIEILT